MPSRARPFGEWTGPRSMGPVGWRNVPPTGPDGVVPRSGPREGEHRDHPAGLLLVLREARHRRGDALPHPRALLGLQLLDGDGERLAAHLDVDPRPGLEVVVPVG